MPLHDYGCIDPKCTGKVIDYYYDHTMPERDREPACPVCGGLMEKRYDLSPHGIEFSGLPTPKYGRQ